MLPLAFLACGGVCIRGDSVVKGNQRAAGRALGAPGFTAGNLIRVLLCACLLLQMPSVAQAYDRGTEDDDEPDIADQFTMGVMGACLAAFVGSAPWWAPPRVIEDDRSLDGRFPHHPYEDGHGGFLILDNEHLLPHTRVGDFFFRGTVDAGSNFDGIDRLGANFHLETRNRWGIDVDWATYNVSPGSHAPDDFDVGDVSFIYRFGQSEHAQWYTGFGFNWLREKPEELNFGYNFTYGADVCIGNPWVFSFQLDAGEVEHNSYFHGRATLGAQWEGVELFTGIDYIDVNVSDASTLVAGFRFWF